MNPFRSTSVGDMIHSDVCGPMSCPSLGSSKYFVTFIDEHSGHLYVVPIKFKGDVAGAFQKFHVWFERKFDCVAKRLHSDAGGEYIALTHYLRDKGIEFEHSAPYSPAHNGIAEGSNGSIFESVRSVLVSACLPSMFWAEALCHTANIRKRFFSPRLGHKTSYEIVTGRKPRLDHLRIFGCAANVFIAKQKRKKLDRKSVKGLILYCYDKSQYKVCINARQTAIKTRYLSIEESERPGRKWFPNGHVPVSEYSESRKKQLLRRSQRPLIRKDHTNPVPDFQYSVPQNGGRTRIQQMSWAKIPLLTIHPPIRVRNTRGMISI